MSTIKTARLFFVVAAAGTLSACYAGPGYERGYGYHDRPVYEAPHERVDVVVREPHHDERRPEHVEVRHDDHHDNRQNQQHRTTNNSNSHQSSQQHNQTQQHSGNQHQGSSQQRHDDHHDDRHDH